ncbi:sulfatase [Roseibacillus ishigakijimensis]|uniref:Sulfatase n=1 Tax=Roseibacillus ishigakijimensis TaxID=454146 RepID=A0A934VMY9_9BACT|nr:sulfatase [Roseibacillus ishigakijimensis]MBK1834470.1 sulfatase [Roseibacillus ishigakijimensis]
MRALLIFLTLTCSLWAEKKPNIVFFLVDDLGIRDLSGEGSSFYETPRIDALAQKSLRFTNGYSTCQVCSPSRASILTGKYPPRIGITDWIGAATGENWKRNDKILPAPNANALPAEDTTLAEALAAEGYATWFFGKWHLGGKGSFPEDHGFQLNVGGHHAGSPPGGFFAPFTNPKISEEIPAGTSLTLWLAERTAQEIRNHQVNEPEKPFLAYLSFYAVHGPIQTTPELWKKYQQKAAANSQADERFGIDRTLPVRQVQDNPIYAGMMETLDQAIGTVLDTLEELELSNDTIVVFTGDNGGVTSGDAFATAALPLRGGKGRQWEGGLRAPYYLYVPGKTQAGATDDTPVTGTDFYPTLLDLAGLDLLPEQHLDGLSLRPLLEGKPLADRPLFWHYPHYGNQGGEPSSILRQGEWKLIQYLEDGRLELYHLSKDSGEQRNLAAEHPERAHAMLVILQRLQKETGALLPEKDPRFDPAKKKQQIENWHTGLKERLEKQHARYLDPSFQPNKNWWGALPQD